MLIKRIEIRSNKTMYQFVIIKELLRRLYLNKTIHVMINKCFKCTCPGTGHFHGIDCYQIQPYM